MSNTWIYIIVSVIVFGGLYSFKRDNHRSRLFHNAIIEGLESRTEGVLAPIANRPDLIKGSTEKHNLNISDHRSHYENIIIDLDHSLGTAITKHVGDHSVSIAKDPMHIDSQKKMQALTTMANFRNTLNSNMIWMDKEK